MTRSPEQPDRPTNPLEADLDALLAQEAASGYQTPAQLEAKVLALTDPRLLSLLDEALAPEQVPDQLANRIIAATTSGSVTTAAQTTPLDARPSVLARIEPAAWRYAAAATIVLAAGVGLWWSGQQAGPGKDFVQIPDEVEIVSLPEYASNAPLFDDATAAVEATLQNVSERIDRYSIDRDSIWSDMDEYEDFISDLELASVDNTPAT